MTWDDYNNAFKHKEESQMLAKSLQEVPVLVLGLIYIEITRGPLKLFEHIFNLLSHCFPKRHSKTAVTKWIFPGQTDMQSRTLMWAEFLLILVPPEISFWSYDVPN